ncbi:MAG: hypothetical protein ACR2FN_04685 [Chitinophagaceae bacterium]
MKIGNNNLFDFSFMKKNYVDNKQIKAYILSIRIYSIKYPSVPPNK